MKELLKSFNLLSEEEIAEIYSVTEVCNLERGEFFIREGSICNVVAYIESGIIRSFYTTEDGEEMTYCISFQNSFMTAYSSFITGQPTLENVQAITPVKLLILKKKDLEQISEKSINCLKFGKFMAEKEYLELERRVFSYQRESAKERYNSLLLNHPKYIEQIPLKYLASYLGITPRHLSRLRTEMI
ncbi:MAG: Crp/Fnr family transcriptional regulator [Sporocytophaga sp.]|uniref:Crp/Fnr family transcriptional regulator n=1 Tax=Sporocytophaga sp. TaxID=2231183 RepID=UPI001B2D0D1C|nr:Crp/Fnr family transcriptional regulator [Sporocytophaga sp.]MBO9702760.1 Crp/Fnr family transcriptional regulator [Sporocytophaga sp.]